jgi:DNA-binding CsgD family transcriptional regulator
MELRNIELTQLPSGEVEVREQTEPIYTLTESNRDFITSFLEVWSERYPKAVANKRIRYKAYEKNRWHYEFLIVRALIKCNLGGNDNRMDIDSEGNFHFEFVLCPMAGECFEWKESCSPKENMAISDAELKVLKHIADGRRVHEIASLLCISHFTVEKHTNNMLRKLGVHNNAALVDYYHKHTT